MSTCKCGHPAVDEAGCAWWPQCTAAKAVADMPGARVAAEDQPEPIERIATALERIADALERFGAAIDPGDRDRETAIVVRPPHGR